MLFDVNITLCAKHVPNVHMILYCLKFLMLTDGLCCVFIVSLTPLKCLHTYGSSFCMSQARRNHASN